MRALLLGGLWLLVSSCPAAPTAEAFGRCDAADVTGSLAQLEAKCPEIGESLRRSGLESLLNAGSRRSLAPKTLDDLAALARRYEGHASVPLPDTRALGAIREQVMGAVASHGVTWWDRIKAWARSWLTRHAADPNSPWNRWLERLARSNGFLLAVGYVCIGLVILMALTVILNELKAAGLLHRRGKRVQTADASPAVLAGHADGPTTVAAQLLQRLIERLRQTGRLQEERSLTHHEVARRAALDSGSHRATLTCIAGLAEASVYAPPRLQMEPDPLLLEQGGRLLEELTPREGA